MIDNSYLDDVVCWSNNILQEYTSKGAYSWLLCRVVSSNLEGPQTWIWRLPIEEKVQFFLWLALHDAFPVADIRFYKQLAPHPMCSHC